MTLAFLAYAYLAALRARAAGKKTGSALWRARLALTVPEIRRLLGALVFWPPVTTRMTLAWSR